METPRWQKQHEQQIQSLELEIRRLDCEIVNAKHRKDEGVCAGDLDGRAISAAQVAALIVGVLVLMAMWNIHKFEAILWAGLAAAISWGVTYAIFYFVPRARRISEFNLAEQSKIDALQRKGASLRHDLSALRSSSPSEKFRS